MTAALSSASILRRKSDVRYRILAGEAVVIRQGEGEVLGLNEVGARLLAEVDGERSLAAIAEQLLAEFEVEPAVLSSDLVAFAEELAAAGVLEEVA